MKQSETAKKYELEHGLLLWGKLFHGDEVTSFKYGLSNVLKNKTAVVHGYIGAQNVVEIETVCPIVAAIGDKIELADGQKGKVASVSCSLLDEKQLRFVTYSKVEKVTTIVVQFV